MELPRDGQEYATITFDEIPTGVTVEVSIDERATWLPTVAGETSDERRILLRGPDSTHTDGTPVGHGTRMWVRVTDNPETVVRAVGDIYVY